jgi:hypothetical protein
MQRSIEKMKVLVPVTLLIGVAAETGVVMLIYLDPSLRQLQA